MIINCTQTAYKVPIKCIITAHKSMKYNKGSNKTYIYIAITLYSLHFLYFPKKNIRTPKSEETSVVIETTYYLYSFFFKRHTSQSI